MDGNGQAAAVAPAEELFRIGEVSRLTATKPFVLRYWETEFPMLQPVKSPKGHRLYRREDVDMVFVIKRLLYDEGFTIAGARRHLRDHVPGAAALEAKSSWANGDSELPVEGHADEQVLQQPSHRGAQHSNLALINRQTLLDLRDSLRSLLTVLESE